MDPVTMLAWIKLVHVGAAFAFVAGHGVSMLVSFRLRHEREAARMLALLDFSGFSLGLAISGAIVLLIAGILDGIVGGFFGRAWTWVALVLFVAIGMLMTPLESRHLNLVRQALGQRTRLMKAGDPEPVPLRPDEVHALTLERSPERGLLIGGGGFLVILALMVLKPF
jgi:MFS family permease